MMWASCCWDVICIYADRLPAEVIRNHVQGWFELFWSRCEDKPTERGRQASPSPTPPLIQVPMCHTQASLIMVQLNLLEHSQEFPCASQLSCDTQLVQVKCAQRLQSKVFQIKYKTNLTCCHSSGRTTGKQNRA